MLEIEVDLGNHCIETAIKRSYNRILSRFLRGRKADPRSEAELALLEAALVHFDFSSLRTAHKALAGKSGSRIVLTGNGGDLPGISIDGSPIEMAPHIRKGASP
jgi:hypothetical protein